MTAVKGFLDANVVLRLLLDDVAGQHEAARALLASGNFRIADAALIEVIFVIGRHYGLTRPEQHDAVRDLLAQPRIDGSVDLFGAAFEIYVKHPKLSFEDSYLVTVAEQSGEGPLWTFDRKLASQSAAVLVGA